jgi:glycine/D-amino acid oxidase-like deaminating enzyme
MAERIAAGCPIEAMRLNQARTIEPHLSSNVVLATYSPLDGYGNSTLTGDVYTHALNAAGADVRILTEVCDVHRDGDGWAVTVRPMTDSPSGENGRAPLPKAGAPQGQVRAKRIVLAGGVWLRDMGRWFGLEVPVLCDTKQMVVSERMPRVVNTVMRIANQRLSIKQVANGTVLFGGGWPAEGTPATGKQGIIPAAFVGNIRAGLYAIPALKGTRLVRSWVGLEQFVADRQPMVGAIPGAPGAFIIGGCVAGYTISPYLTLLLAQLILGKEPERPLFSPDRYQRQAA